MCYSLQLWASDQMLQLAVFTYWQGAINFNLKQYWTSWSDHSLLYHHNLAMARRKIYNLTYKTKDNLNLSHYHRHLMRAIPKAVSVLGKKNSLTRDSHCLQGFQVHIYGLVLSAASSSYPQGQSGAWVKLHPSSKILPDTDISSVTLKVPSLSCSLQFRYCLQWA